MHLVLASPSAPLAQHGPRVPIGRESILIFFLAFVHLFCQPNIELLLDDGRRASVTLYLFSFVRLTSPTQRTPTNDCIVLSSSLASLHGFSSTPFSSTDKPYTPPFQPLLDMWPVYWDPCCAVLLWTVERSVVRATIEKVPQHCPSLEGRIGKG